MLLHYWMAVFGRGDFAVRALSGVDVGDHPSVFLAGRAAAGRADGRVGDVLLGPQHRPFAINYATSARMYSLMILLSLLGYLALSRALTSRPAAA